ncbi:SH3 domain-containing protein [Kaistia soli DSM 19436]|uniref:SH3 domain-containing protein n=1 Tax=Kaistia soli DSM 19436 TaxID=1122133 RepID=A0A1M5P0Y6_9HYPH|nr:NlpC/P60 family protein [Kaistia soli]SHG95367.1 SH3 domain-containing protein [Kaistia soli DSM 19436]
MNALSLLDPRSHAFRPDLADARLQGRVEAQRFVEGTLRRITAASTPIRGAPRTDGGVASEALHGEVVRVFEETIEGWAFVQLETDGYVGYVASDALGAVDPGPTHRVTALRTFVYPEADLRRPPLGLLSFGSVLALGGEAVTRGTPYRLLKNGMGAVVATHVAPIDDAPALDFVSVAERFIETPYLWGGRTSLGLDCSALVQLSLAATGIKAPRDSDQQAASLGDVLSDGLLGTRLRGDLVFWKGHVGIVADPETLLHASGYQMEVVAEPLDEAVARIAASAGLPTVVRRIAFET